MATLIQGTKLISEISGQSVGNCKAWEEREKLQEMKIGIVGEEGLGQMLEEPTAAVFFRGLCSSIL